MKKGQEVHSNNAGYTLIELLIVVVLVALFTNFALPRLTSYFEESIKTVSRDIAGIVREVYQSTLLTGRVHRIVWDLRNNEYWVESGPATVLLDTEATLEKERDRAKFASSDEKARPSVFKMDESITKKKRPLPDGIKFEDVVTEQTGKAQESGIAYTHFFPHGITEQTIIAVQDLANHKLSIIVSALIGRTQIRNEIVKPEDVFGK